LQHIAFCFWNGLFFLAVKSKNQRAAPTAQNKKTRQKKLPEAKLHNVVL
jgi:hypothetical protein